MADAAVRSSDLDALVAGRCAVVVERDEIVVEGPEAAGYLQGQLTQDVTGLEIGSSALTFLLLPQGRIVALGRLRRDGDDAFVLDVDAGWGEVALARLLRFKLRTKAAIELASGVPYLVRFGPSAGGPDTVVPSVPGITGGDLPRAEAPTVPVPVVDPTVLAAVRARAGVPAAVDLDDRAVPAETGLVAAAVSFTKGCYTGQELVARMDSRGAEPPRRIRRVRGAGAPPPAGAVLRQDDREAGTLTTTVGLDDGWLGLALVPRAAGGGAIDVVIDGSPAPAEVDP